MRNKLPYQIRNIQFRNPAWLYTYTSLNAIRPPEPVSHRLKKHKYNKNTLLSLRRNCTERKSDRIPSSATAPDQKYNSKQFNIMDTILRKPEVTHFNISDHLEFHTLSYRICENNQFIFNAHPLMDDYRIALDREKHVYKWIRKSEFTAKKVDAEPRPRRERHGGHRAHRYENLPVYHA
jgi:hypothetical protein